MSRNCVPPCELSLWLYGLVRDVPLSRKALIGLCRMVSFVRRRVRWIPVDLVNPSLLLVIVQKFRELISLLRVPKAAKAVPENRRVNVKTYFVWRLFWNIDEKPVKFYFYSFLFFRYTFSKNRSNRSKFSRTVLMGQSSETKYFENFDHFSTEYWLNFRIFFVFLTFLPFSFHKNLRFSVWRFQSPAQIWYYCFLHRVGKFLKINFHNFCVGIIVYTWKIGKKWLTNL